MNNEPMNPMNPTVYVSPRGEERIRSGHPWVYRSDLVDVQAAGGDTVQVLSTRGRPLGFLARNDPKVRALEGLEQKIEVLYGTVPDIIEVREGPVRYEVDVHHGQ